MQAQGGVKTYFDKHEPQTYLLILKPEKQALVIQTNVLFLKCAFPITEIF